MMFTVKNNFSTSVHRKFINNARQLNLTRKRWWLDRLFNKNKVFALSTGSSDNFTLFETTQHRDIYREQLYQMIDILDRKYEKNWDLQVDYDANNQKYHFSIIINYPHIHITNTSNHEREIFDLLVLIPVKWHKDSHAASPGSPKGTRLTYAEDEWKAGYLHSHLTKRDNLSNLNDLFNVSSFCIGSEDMSELVIEQYHSFDAGIFELFLYTLDNMVAWESLEGTPHYRMANVSTKTGFVIPSWSGYPAKEVYGHLTRSIEAMSVGMFGESIPCNINFAYVNNKFVIKQDEVFTNYIRRHFIENPALSSIRQYVLCKLSSDNSTYYGFTDSQVNSATDLLKNKTNLPFVYIQGTKHEFKIVNINAQKQEDINEYIIHPKFLRYVAEQLEIYLYESCIRGSSYHKLANTFDNVRRDSEQNQVFV